MTDYQVRWIVVIKRETDPAEVTPFHEYQDAKDFFDQWSQQWTESYLCGVLKGPLT